MTCDTPSSRARGGSIFAAQYTATTVGVLIIITVIAFEAMAVATAMPTAASRLHGLAYYGWAFTGFLISSVLGMVSAGWYCDRSSARMPVLVGMGLFVAGLLVAGAAPQMWVLIAGRILQGLAGGLLITAMYVVLGGSYPDAIRPRIFAAVASAWVVPGLAGPLVAGWVTEQLSWRWVFWGLIPAGFAGLALLTRPLSLLPLAAPPGTVRRELRSGLRRLSSALLAGAGIAAIADLAEHRNRTGIVLGIAGLAALATGLKSLLPPGTVSFRPGVPAAVAFRGLLAGTFAGMESVVPLTLTVQHGYSPTLAGMPLMCSAVTWAFGSFVQGRMRAPNRGALMAIGLAMVAGAGLGMAAVADGRTASWVAMPVWGLAGLGAGLALTSASVVMLESTTDTARGADSAALQLADSVFSALCTAFVGALVAAAAAGATSYGTALSVSFAILAAVAALAVTRSGRLVAVVAGAAARPPVSSAASAVGAP